MWSSPLPTSKPRLITAGFGERRSPNRSEKDTDVLYNMHVYACITHTHPRQPCLPRPLSGQIWSGPGLGPDLYLFARAALLAKAAKKLDPEIPPRARTDPERQGPCTALCQDRAGEGSIVFFCRVARRDVSCVHQNTLEQSRSLVCVCVSNNGLHKPANSQPDCLFISSTCLEGNIGIGRSAFGWCPRDASS